MQHLGYFASSAKKALNLTEGTYYLSTSGKSKTL